MNAPDDPTPDTVMESGSDAGEPGGHLGPGDLTPEEERLLAALERGVRSGPTPDPEQTVGAVRAAEDEGPLPAGGGAPGDGLTPRFTAPGAD